MNDLILKNCNIIGADSISCNTDIKISGGRIVDIGIFDEAGIDCSNKFISPGFIDIHTHGGYGFDFMDSSDRTFQNIVLMRHLTAFYDSSWITEQQRFCRQALPLL